DVWTSIPRIPHPEQNQLRSGLCFLVFLLLTASVSAYMGAALLEILVTLTFLGLRATYYHERLTRVNWPCLVGKPLGLGSAKSPTVGLGNDFCTDSVAFFRLQDFLRCISAAIIFIVVGFAVIATNHGGSAVSAFFILLLFLLYFIFY
uniref:CKLF like MARVEL transmembrane domain containing 5 n=1 Tax=Pseudonaja textilis TaxID=8673 RepID=A0A670YR74_PSETE